MPRKKALGERTRVIGAKYPIEIERRILAVSAELTRRTGGVPVPTSSIMVQITSRGLDAYERELGITKGKS